MTVEELFQKVVVSYGEETPKTGFFDAVHAIQDYIGRRLWLNSADYLQASFTTTLAADSHTILLPSRTLALVEDEFPWVKESGSDHTATQLAPLPTGMRHRLTVKGVPRFYEVRNRRLRVFPTPEEDCDIFAEVYRLPDKVAVFAEDLPWDGMFDDVFVETVKKASQAGSVMTVLPELEAFVYRHVDMVLEHRPLKSVSWRSSL